MEKTSERLDPEVLKSTDENINLLVFHIATYKLIKGYVKDKIVLDFGCGEGYGSSIMKDVAKKVVGVDVSSDVIIKAREKYRFDNLEFLFIDKLEKKGLMFQDKTFDVVVASQVFEHLDNFDIFFKEVKRILKDDGFLILTTPNSSLRLLPFQTPWNHHHKRELNYFEIDSMLSKYFPSYKIFGITFLGIPLRKEIRRVTKLKIFLYPFTNIVVPEKIKLNVLKTLWDIFRKRDILSKILKRKKEKYYDVDKLTKRVIITDNPRKKWLSFICFCYKK